MAGEKIVRCNVSYQFGPGTIGGTVASITCDAQSWFSKTIPANTTNGEIDIAVDVSTVVVAAIEANKNCSVYTNAASTGDFDDTLTLLANQAVGWKTNDVAALFLTVDVVKLFVTTGAEATTISFGVGVDATPGL